MKIEELATNIKNRIRNDKDAVVAITGYEGDGKSTLAIDLAKLISSGFTFEKNELFSPSVEDIQDKIQNLAKYEPIVADEAIKAFYKKMHSSKMSIILNIIYALCRQENKVSILCMPRFTDFLEFFRNHRIFLWLHVLKRGTAIAFTKDWSPFSIDPWYLKYNQSAIDNYFNKTPLIEQELEEKIEALERTKGFLGVVTFDDLDEETKKVYLESKKAEAYKDIDDYWDSTQSEREKLLRGERSILAKALYEQGMTEEEIGELVNKRHQTISNWINSANLQ